MNFGPKVLASALEKTSVDNLPLDTRTTELFASSRRSLNYLGISPGYNLGISCCTLASVSLSPTFVAIAMNGVHLITYIIVQVYWLCPQVTFTCTFLL